MKLPDNHKPHLYSDIEKYQMHNELVAAQLTVAHQLNRSGQGTADITRMYLFFKSELNSGKI